MSDIGKKLKLKKEVINNQTLDEDIKNNIKQVMKKEYEKNDDNIKEKHKFPIWNKVLVTAACVLIVSSATFAGSIGDFITNIFKNTEKNANQIIKPENIIEINSEYVTCNGISLNIGYLYEDDDYLYIAMNVRGVDNDAFGIMMDKIIIKNIDNDEIYSNIISENNKYLFFDVQYKIEEKIIVLTINKNYDIKLLKNIEINITNLTFLLKDEKYNKVSGNWIFNIKKP